MHMEGSVALGGASVWYGGGDAVLLFESACCFD